MRCNEGLHFTEFCRNGGLRGRGAVFCAPMATGVFIAAMLVYATWRVAFGYPATGRRFSMLNRAEAAFIASTANAMYPPGGAIPCSGSEADLPGYMDRLLAASAPRIRVLMHLLFFLLEHATLFFPVRGWGGMRRFSALSLEQQVAALDGWQNSRLFPRRLVFTSMRAILTLGYFAHPPVLRALDLAPFAIETPVCEADLLYPRIGEHPDTIPFTTADIDVAGSQAPLELSDPIDPAYAEESS